MQKLENENVSVQYYDKSSNISKPYIIARDKRDRNNMPAAFTTKIRGIEMAWSFLSDIFSKYELKNDVMFSDIVHSLDSGFHLATHYYCEMD